ncbi:hypothetical protein [Olleya sp. YS]|uniref:hypothetical protein n=1 Tax=Olleya sp. YS TaxID=3028318 RepID=UPI0024344827|nr:hypothetical protein [Olleya sp. YS]WGD34193.1 hypothetical protein Ollyesu_10440 [Olleya sp. YS]
MEPLRKNNTWNLFTGIILTVFGSYRLYQYFSGVVVYKTYRLVLSIGFVLYGLFSLYQYVKIKNNK